jgi:hypothetical protein
MRSRNDAPRPEYFPIGSPESRAAVRLELSRRTQFVTNIRTPAGMALLLRALRAARSRPNCELCMES